MTWAVTCVDSQPVQNVSSRDGVSGTRTEPMVATFIVPLKPVRPLISLKARRQRHAKMTRIAAFPDPHRMNTTSLSMFRCKRWWAVLLGALITSPLAAQPDTDPAPGDYRVEGGRVDRGTHTGWRLFHTTCYGCHGVGGVGTDLAPNLVERVKTLTPRAFVTKVLTSYRIVLPDNDANPDDHSAVRAAMIEEVMRRKRGIRGQIIMPAWDADPTVNPHVLDLFAYLSARADGKLGPGEPKLLLDK